MRHDQNRRRLLSALTLAPFACVSTAPPRSKRCRRSFKPPSRPRPRSSRGRAHCATRRCARAIRPMARWWCATASSSARAGTTSCCRAIRPRIRNCWRCATRRAGSARATCRNAMSIPPRSLRDVPGRALLGPHPPRLHRARCRGGPCAEAWVLSDAAFREALCGARNSPPSTAAAWPISTRARATRSCSSTATRPRPICGATSCRTAPGSGG